MTVERHNSKVTVSFRTPVAGVDQVTGDDFIANRHVIIAMQVTQDESLTAFVDDNGEVVAEWSTPDVEKMEWRSLEVASNVGSIEWRRKMQGKNPMAYEPWSAEEDDALRKEVAEGLVAQMARAHRRGTGAIRSRLHKLELRD